MNTHIPLFMMLYTATMFGLWPIVMQWSGYGPFAQSLALTAVGSICFVGIVLAMAWKNGEAQIVVSGWHWALIAGAMGTSGLFALNLGLSLAGPEKIGVLVAVMATANAVVPVVYQAVATGRLSLAHGAGITFAVVAVILLSTKPATPS